MGISELELLCRVIRPTLCHLQESADGAETLLLAASNISDHGHHLTTDAGEGLGLYGISRTQHRAIWDNYLVNYPELASRVRGLASQREFLAHPDDELITNLSYATAIAWLLIRQCREQPDCRNTSPEALLGAVFGRRDRAA